MPLTPADIHNVAFKKLPMGKRGYDAEEVDAFLDEVEHELTRLMEENHELRVRAGHGSSPGPRLDAGIDEVRAQLDQLQRDKAAAEQAARAMRAELEQARSRGGLAVADNGDHQTVGMLMMAQRTADDHLADARREVGKLLADAGAKADEVTREASAAADALERDARQRHQDALAAVDAQRTETLKRIEELQGFLREYHTRLKAHVEGQLRDLDGRGGDLQPS